MATERTAIQVPEDALEFERSKTTIYMWRSEYNGERTIAVASRGPKTGNFVKMGIPSFDGELAAAFVALSDGWNTGEGGVVAAEAPTRSPRRR